NKAWQLHGGHGIAVLYQQGGNFSVCIRIGETGTGHGRLNLGKIELLIMGVPYRLDTGQDQLVDNRPLLFQRPPHLIGVLLMVMATAADAMGTYEAVSGFEL